MENYRNTAFYLALWYAFLAALIAVLLIALNDVTPATGLLIAANAALLLALGLMVATSGRLNAQFWRTLPPQERPTTEAARQMACRALEETWLRFAKGAAVAAIVLCVFAHMSNGVSASALANAMRTPATAKPEAGNTSAWSNYRSARLAPTN